MGNEVELRRLTLTCVTKLCSNVISISRVILGERKGKSIHIYSWLTVVL